MPVQNKNYDGLPAAGAGTPDATLSGAESGWNSGNSVPGLPEKNQQNRLMIFMSFVAKLYAPQRLALAFTHVRHRIRHGPVAAGSVHRVVPRKAVPGCFCRLGVAACAAHRLRARISVGQDRAAASVACGDRDTRREAEPSEQRKGRPAPGEPRTSTASHAAPARPAGTAATTATSCPTRSTGRTGAYARAS